MTNITLSKKERERLQQEIFMELSMADDLQEYVHAHATLMTKLVKETIDSIEEKQKEKPKEKKPKEGKKIPLYAINEQYHFSSYEKFIEKFPEHPIIEFWESSISELISPKKQMDVVRIVTLYERPDNVVMVEVPKSDEIFKYIENSLKIEREL